MADEQTVQEQPSKPEAPHGAQEQKPEETDWKAEARKWESRAKANKTAADELDQLKQSQMSDQQKTQAKAEKLQKELDALKSKEQIGAWRKQASAGTGVPEDVLRGSTLEDIQSHADQLKTLLHPAPKAPRVPGAERQPQNPSADQGDWLRNIFYRK